MPVDKAVDTLVRLGLVTTKIDDDKGVIMLVEVRFTQIIWSILLDIISCFPESNLFWCCKRRSLPLAYHNLPVVLFPLYVVVPHIVTINILGDMHFGTLSVVAPEIFSRVFKKMQKLYKLYNNNKKKLNKKSDILISMVWQCPMSFHMLVRVSLPTLNETFFESQFDEHNCSFYSNGCIKRPYKNSSHLHNAKCLI